MTMELEGNLLLERAHTRRWVSIIAVIIPVAAFVLGAAWFIRALSSHQPRCSQSHDDGGRPAASAAHRAQAGDGRGAETTVTGCGRGCRCPGGASGQRDAGACIRVADVATLRQHRVCQHLAGVHRARPRTFCRRPHLSRHRSPNRRQARPLCLSRTPKSAELKSGKRIAESRSGAAGEAARTSRRFAWCSAATATEAH